MRHAPAACALLLLACGAAPATPPPHLVLLLVDTLRPDHLGAYGYERPTSRNLDALAARGVLFTRAAATSSWTKPSVGSLFTSRLPSEHGAISFHEHLARELPTLAELLRGAGYHTLGVSGNFVHIREATGFARGFDTWVTLWKRGRAQGDALWTQSGRTGRRVHRRAPWGHEINEEVLRHLPHAGGAPLFLYVHYMEPHPGYAPPKRWRNRFVSDPALHADRPVASTDFLRRLVKGELASSPELRRWLLDLYDAEIAAVDEAIGGLLAALRERGYAEHAVVAVLSDHGEEFEEHGSWFHGLTLHRESLAVPLIFHDARRPRAARQREEPVDLLDVAPTLLALAGVPKPGAMRGRDLFASRPDDARELVAELHPEAHALPRRQRLALTRWPWKALVPSAGEPVVYRLDRDPGETTPVPAVGSRAAGAMAARSTRLVEQLSALRAGPATGGLDEESLEGLRALGYID